MSGEGLNSGQRFRRPFDARGAALFLRQNWFLILALLSACLAAWPLMSQPGLLNTTRGGGDSPFLLQRLQQLETALLGGHFPVRWMPDANYGFGYPFFNYYAPLSFYISVLFRFIGFSYVRAIQLSQLAGFLTAALGMFHLARRWFGSNWAGLMASVSYTLAPFHLVNVYVRGDSLAEFWAMAFYPLVILTAENLLDDKAQTADKRGAIALFALSYGGLILTHNISALIFTPFLLLYLLLRWWKSFRTITTSEFSQAHKARLLKALHMSLAVGLILGLALAATFFLPALTSTELVQLGPATEGHFYFGNHFRGWELIQKKLLFDYNPEGGLAFNMGLAQTFVAAGGIIILVFAVKRAGSKDNKSYIPVRLSLDLPNVLFILLTLLASTWMITSLSRALWENLPLLPFTQFPWRFLSVQTVVVALSSAAIALLPWRRVLVPMAILLILVSSLSGIETAHLFLGDEDVTAGKLAEYEWFTGNIGTTVSAEYLPKTVQPRSYSSLWLITGDRMHVQPLSGELIESQQIKRAATRQVWSVAVRSNGNSQTVTLSFPTIFWPGWRAAVDGKSIDIRPERGSGLITMDLTPGDHEVSLWLGRTPIRLIADLTSLMAVATISWLLLSARRLRISKIHLYGAILLLLLAIGLRLRPNVSLSPNNLSWDFAQMGYLHHSPEGIVFENGGILESYTYSRDELPAGETLRITLDWRAAAGTSPTQMSVDLGLPAVNRFQEAPFIASQTNLVASGAAAFELLIPENAPGGLFVPRLTVGSSHALMSKNRLRGDLFLRPLRITEKQLPADVADPPLAVHAVKVQQRETGTLDLQLAWLTQHPLGQNYKIALRLLDGNGLQLSQFDNQPGYGYLPTTSWTAGRWVNVWTALPIPTELSGESPYILTAQLYEPDTLAAVLTRSLGELVPVEDALVFEARQPVFSLPAGMTPLYAEFEGESGGIIQLHGYEVEQTSGEVSLTLYWGALEAEQTDYTRFVHLSHVSGDQQPVAQNDGMARNNSYPTSQWIKGEVVADQVVLNLDEVEAGEYQILIGWYRNLGDRFPRLPATDADGDRFPFDRVPLPLTVTVGDG